MPLVVPAAAKGETLLRFGDNQRAPAIYIFKGELVPDR